MNFAGVFQAPIVFVCINNQWAISIPRSRQTRAKTLAHRALAYGFPGVQVDGNDLLAVVTATREAIDRAREGRGPSLIEAVTYRLAPHSTADRPQISMRPVGASNNLVISEKSVVLPAPFGPSNAVTLPGNTSKLRPSAV